MSTSPSSPSATSTSTEHLSNTSNLLFGFLVSALSVFAIFMTSALVWNRLVARRRSIDAMLEINVSPQLRRLHRPKMWDVWASPHKQSSSWPDIRPVSVSKWIDDPTDLSQTTRAGQIPSLWRRTLNRVPPEISYLFHRPLPEVVSTPNDATSSAELPEGSDVQVSLLICMPYALQVNQRRQGEGEATSPRLPEMAFATTNIPLS